MLSKFVQDTQAETVGRWLRDVDFYSAHTLGVEREIFEALARAHRRKVWSPTPIAPLAEPTNLQELVGDHFNGAQEELGFQAKRVDNLYRWLSDTNNTYKAEMESVEKNVQVATDALQDILVIKHVSTDNSFWVSDSFNSTSYIDKSRTTAQIDTDHGVAMLAATSLDVVENVQPFVNDKETVGIPGCNLLVLDKGNAGGPEREPEPLFESQQSTDFSNVLDADSQTWFELERNFIKPKQKCSQFGRAWVKNSSGTEIDVLTVTQNLDWKAYVQWFNRSLPDSGTDGKGRWLAEFRDLDGTNSTTPNIQAQAASVENWNLGLAALGVKPPTQEQIEASRKLAGLSSNTSSPQQSLGPSDTACRLAFDLVLLDKQPLSFINLIPFTRGTSPIRVELLRIWSGDFNLILAKDVELTPTANSTTSLSREIARRTGTQTVGGLYSVPTDRPIDRVEIKLSSLPQRVPLGLGHPFQEKYEVTRKEQRMVFFSRVDRDYVWTRIPLNESPPSISAVLSQSKILGSLPSSLNSLLQYARTLEDKKLQLQKDLARVQGGAEALNLKGVQNDLGALQSGLSAVGLGKVLGKAIPVVGGILAAVDLGKQLFGFSKSTELLEVRRGYDIFDGWRASIGLRDVKLTRAQFAEQSEVVSVAWTFPAPVKKIGLFVEDWVPDTWGPGDWATYYLSVDGNNWVPVMKMGSTNIDSSFTPDAPTSQVYFKGVMKGNPSDPSTPVQIRHYSIQGLPA